MPERSQSQFNHEAMDTEPGSHGCMESLSVSHCSCLPPFLLSCPPAWASYASPLATGISLGLFIFFPLLGSLPCVLACTIYCFSSNPGEGDILFIFISTGLKSIYCIMAGSSTKLNKPKEWMSFYLGWNFQKKAEILPKLAQNQSSPINEHKMSLSPIVLHNGSLVSCCYQESGLG